MKNFYWKTLSKMGLGAVLAFIFWMGGLSRAVGEQEKPAIQTVTSPTPAYDHYLEVVSETRRLREARDTQGLELLAAKLRESKESSDGGTWFLSSFYSNAVDLPGEDAAKADEAMKFYRNWAEKSPESITAQICLAEALTSYAWNARGSGYASSVTREGWRLYEERLNQAWEVLAKAQNLNEKCPEWYSAAQTVALGQGWDHVKYMTMMDEALQKEPTYGKYYAKTCLFLYPRWYGKTGDFEKWIGEEADRYPPETRDWHYSRFVWMADTLGYDSEMVFAKGRLDWDRTQRGFDEWLKQEPENLMVRFQYLRLALLANDRKVARAQFEATAGKYWPPMWDRSQAKFEQARSFAYDNGENPQQQKALKSIKISKKLSPEVAKKAELIIRLFSGFLGGLIAGILCAIMAIRHRQAGAGAIALVICVVAGTCGGSLLAIIPSAALVVYLFLTKSLEKMEPSFAPSPGIGFLWLILVAGFDLVLQIGATVFLAASYAASAGGMPPDFQGFSNRFYESGEASKIVLNSSWLSVLLLLVICGKQTAADCRLSLGLLPFHGKTVIKYLVPAAVILFLLGLGLDSFQDPKTKEAMIQMAGGIKSPVIFVVCIVLVAPIFEEMLYRGFLFQMWYPKLGFWGTALGGSVIFTLSHFQCGWVGLLYILIFSLTLYFLRWKTGSVIPTMTLHFLNNAATCVAMFLTPT